MSGKQNTTSKSIQSNKSNKPNKVKLATNSKARTLERKQTKWLKAMKWYADNNHARGVIALDPVAGKDIVKQLRINGIQAIPKLELKYGVSKSSLFEVYDEVILPLKELSRPNKLARKQLLKQEMESGNQMSKSESNVQVTTNSAAAERVRLLKEKLAAQKEALLREAFVGPSGDVEVFRTPNNRKTENTRLAREELKKQQLDKRSTRAASAVLEIQPEDLPAEIDAQDVLLGVIEDRKKGLVTLPVEIDGRKTFSKVRTTGIINLQSSTAQADALIADMTIKGIAKEEASKQKKQEFEQRVMQLFEERNARHERLFEKAEKAGNMKALTALDANGLRYVSTLAAITGVDGKNTEADGKPQTVIVIRNTFEERVKDV